MTTTTARRQADRNPAPDKTAPDAAPSLLSAEEQLVLSAIRAKYPPHPILSRSPVTTVVRRAWRASGFTAHLDWPRRLLLLFGCTGAIQLGWLISEVRRG